MRAAAGKRGNLLSSVVERIGEERLWLLRWTAIGLVANKIIVMYAAGVGMRYRFGAQSSSGFLHYLLVKNFIQWDAWWFTGISSSGYTPKGTAFYPFYPLLIRGVSEALRVSVYAAAVLVSWVCFALGLYFLLKLLRLDLDRPRAVRAMLLLALFPTAFYFSAAYTESLFLLLMVLTLYALRRQRWAAAGGWGGLAAVTRNTGIALGLPFLIEYFQAWWKRPRPRPRPWGALWVVLIGAGAFTYFGYLWAEFGDPFIFVGAEGQYGRGWAAPWTTLYSGFRYNLGWFDGLRLSLPGLRLALREWSPIYYTTQLFFPTVALVVLAASFRKMRWSYWVILLYSVVVPLTVPANVEVIDYFVGFSRYMLIVIPLFIGLERLLRWRWLFWSYLAFSAILLLLFTYAFSGHRVVA
jgi:hypothetical protein